MTTYEPGQSAIATVRGIPNVRVVNFGNGEWFTGDYMGPYRSRFHSDRYVTDIRPLVVLDPQDAKEILGYLSIRSISLDMKRIFDQIEAQLPPGIEEPTGLGAVVEGRNGRRYSRPGRRDTSCPWFRVDTPDAADPWYAWSEFDATEVLTEGWSG